MCVLVYNISAHLGPSCAHVTGNVFVLLGHAGALEAGVHLGRPCLLLTSDNWQLRLGKPFSGL